jgi:hypothetical protein
MEVNKHLDIYMNEYTKIVQFVYGLKFRYALLKVRSHTLSRFFGHALHCFCLSVEAQRTKKPLVPQVGNTLSSGPPEP